MTYISFQTGDIIELLNGGTDFLIKYPGVYHTTMNMNISWFNEPENYDMLAVGVFDNDLPTVMIGLNVYIPPGESVQYQIPSTHVTGIGRLHADGTKTFSIQFLNATGSAQTNSARLIGASGDYGVNAKVNMDMNLLWVHPYVPYTGPTGVTGPSP